MSTEQKLEAARKRLTAAQEAWNRQGLPRDPGALSGITRRGSARKHAANIDRTSDIAREGVAAEKEVKRLEGKLRVERKNAHIRDTATMSIPLAELKPGDRIRYEQYGSPRNAGTVVRVNKKTVTLEAPSPGFDQPKIPHEKIIASMRPDERTKND